MNELVSVIVPVYKVEKYIDKCVNSIIEQTYDRMEILLVDDGSPDNCGHICDEYAKKDSRIRVIHKENGGLSSARNAALDVVQGEWVLCVDSDDYIETNMIQRLISSAHEYDADIVVCSHYQEKKDKLSIVEKIVDDVLVFDKMQALGKLVEDQDIKNYAWGKLYRACLFDGVRYPDGRNYEDIATTYLLFDRAKRVVKIPDYLYYYLIREDSISYNKSAESWHKGCHASCIGQEERVAYFASKGYEELKKRSLALLVPYLYSDILSGYKADKSGDVETTKKYLRDNYDDIVNNPYISIKDKKLLDIYLRNRKDFELYNQVKKSIKSPLKLINKLKKKFTHRNLKLDFSLSEGKTKRIIYIELPCFDNLGDHAIAYAAEELLKKMCEESDHCQLFIINGWDVNRTIPSLKKQISPNDCIVCQGGGNFGSLYEFAEVFRRRILKAFKDNKIIIMPQTIYYTDDAKGLECLKQDKEAIEACKNIEIFARDGKSYELMKKYFNVKITQLHDTVSMFDGSEYSSEDRNGIVLCLRSDIESSLNTDQKKKITKLCNDTSEKVFVTDTCTNFDVEPPEREEYLISKWKLWGRARLVVTDRLHGMIFSIITRTPCVVLGNNHHKVFETYKTFKECKYLFFADDVCKVGDYIDEALGLGNVEQIDLNCDKDVLRKSII